MALSFEELGLQPQFIKAVREMGFESPTPIQEAAIPALLEGRSVIGQAQTGTGKTAAFVLPLLHKVESGKMRAPQALILAPTRELAIQVTDAARQMAQETPLRVMTVYGGQAYSIQLRQIDRGVDVVVGTPGRMLDLIKKKLLDLSHVKYMVLDEADEMLEMGFIEDVETIFKAIPAERQTALFSATLPDAIRKLAAKYIDDPLQVSVITGQRTVAETTQQFLRVRDENKQAVLLRILEAEEVKSALVFTRTKARAQELSDELNRLGYPAGALHGDLDQSKREWVMDRFRRKVINLLVATDVAARGLDIDDVSHVFNYDMPEDTEDYIHRIGRTGRAGKKGNAITFIHSRERGRLSQIEGYVKQKISEYTLPTRDEILQKRDERFAEKLTNEMSDGKLKRETALVAKMVEFGFDPIEIAAAAIKMARSGETPVPSMDLTEPAPISRSQTGRGDRRDGYASRDNRASRGNADRAGNNAGGGFRTGRPRKAPEAGMVRFRMNLGNQHGIRPGDVVGAIASEVGISGKSIGAIDIQTDCTFVDVAEQHARQVLQKSGGKYSLRGKTVVLKLA
ncbi:ATP-dependent RNA helicase DeaD [Leptolinea sp. HRD-7]|nr:ATP-dependent RNA helicase DeaD [Leptolinea sp. HRD-7]